MNRVFLVVAVFSIWHSISRAEYPPSWYPPVNPAIPPTRNYGPPPVPVFLPPEDPCGGVPFDGPKPAISWNDLVEIFNQSSKASPADLKIGKEFHCYIVSNVSRTYRDYQYGTSEDSPGPDWTFHYDNPLCPATFSAFQESGTSQLKAEANGETGRNSYAEISANEAATATNFIYAVGGLDFLPTVAGQEIQAAWSRRIPQSYDVANLTVRANKIGLSLYYRGEGHYSYSGYLGSEQEIMTTGLEGLAVCWEEGNSSPGISPKGKPLGASLESGSGDEPKEPG